MPNEGDVLEVVFIMKKGIEGGMCKVVVSKNQ